MPPKTQTELVTEELTQVKDELRKSNEENLLLRAEITSLKAQKTPTTPVALPPPPVFRFSGRSGGQFSIDGRGFGSDVRDGIIRIDERDIVATRWKDTSIKGVIPNDIKPGKHKITVNGTTVETTF